MANDTSSNGSFGGGSNGAAATGEAKFQELLRRMVELGASDLHLKTGLPPVVRINDDLKMLSKKIAPLSRSEMQEVCAALVPEHLRALFQSGQEIDTAYSLSNVGRFRLNIYRYRTQLGLVARFIPIEIRSIKDLGLPEVIRQMALAPRGLILVTGTTGSGKSTTLAAMINEWNATQSGHVITIEDPIEYLIRDRKSIITQREIGLDTQSFAQGLKNSLRQDPDVIMIGELRDRETITTALTAAETGHLVLATLHTKDSLETVNRILGVFPPEAQQEVRWQFASCLTGIISQRLLPALDVETGKPRGRIAAVEILVSTSRIRDLLLDPLKQDKLKGSIEQGHEAYGMQSFDQHLMALLSQKRITRETALRNSSSPADFELKLRGIDSADGARWRSLDKGTGAGGAMTNFTTGGKPTLELDDFRRKKGE